ncbi:MAG: TetR family transcriptional regulator C-terminal domain-containing protein [Rickettsiales bacterium]|nr:TetR family transcriptional regulator C-terminal domain-containing protein [Rickettsiales bacterium]
MPRTNVKDKRKQQLINATIDSIAKRGLTETTITHISKGAGMSRGIINFYFQSKEMMMRDVLSSLLDDVEAIWISALEKENDTRAQLDALINALFDRKVCSPKRLNVLSAFWGHAASHDAYRQRIDESDSKLQQIIAALWNNLNPEGYSADLFARQLHAMVRGLWLSYLMAPKTVDREDLAAECRAFVEQHLQPIRVVNSEEPVTATPAKAGKKAKKADDTRQMDIEDLFGTLS